MQVTIQGNTLDLGNVKYLEMDGTKFAMVPVLSATVVKTKTARKLPENTTASKVREWLDTAEVGDTIYMKAPTRYAISAPAEMINRCIKIKPLAGGRNFKLTYMGKKQYARSQYA